MPETEGLNTFQILEKLKLTEGKKLKRASIILFGKDPMRFYPNIQVKIGRFGIDAADLRFQEIVEGNLVQMLHEVQVQLNYKFLTRPITFEVFQRLENDLYPIDALREMLLNALVHRTYMGATIQMRVYDDQLSIWNEGALPYGLSLEDLKKEHSSRPRNPLIANACFLGGYIDTWGRGTLKIINACREAGLPEPEFTEKNGGVSMTVCAHSLASMASQNIREKTSEKTKVEFGKNSERIRKEFGSEVGRAFEIIYQSPEFTAEQIAEKLGKTQRTVENYIARLKKAGVITRRGPKLGGYWEVNTTEK
ncbi:MAG: ATP-binding protein [Spirochaetia bacterium]|nr:ATP-binding protein [Spirochaetia bacterium]